MEIKIPLFEKYGVKAFVGGCVRRGEGSRFRAKAHCHYPSDGWICFLSNKWISCEPLLIHELAHHLTNCGHTDKWRNKVIELGGTINAIPGILKSYEKNKRNNKGEIK